MSIRYECDDNAVLWTSTGANMSEPLDLDAALSELRRLRESSEKLLDLNFGFMEQNRLLREENARLKYQVEEAHCPCDHTVMYANGLRSCDSCPWAVPAPSEVTK